MRLQQTLYLTACTSYAAGCLTVWGLGQGTMHFSIPLVGLAFAVAGLPLGWVVIRMGSSFSAAKQQIGAESTMPAETGFVELDHLCDQLSGKLLQAKQAQQSQSRELQEIHRLLERLDRREGAFDREGDPHSAVERLRTILAGYANEFDSTVRQTLSCSREILRATEEMVSGAEVQSDAVNQSTSVLEQLAERIISVCDNAAGAIESSHQTRDDARQQLADCRELIEEIKQIQNYASVRERKLRALGQNTKEIESIVQTIGSLSSRTDLLALNASIESVRAGEHGRGFAVVAEEVRTLAEQSAQAVLDINRRIEMVQLEMHQSISVASNEHDQMQQFIKRITETFEALENISKTANDSADQLSQISISANDQLRLTREVVSTLEYGNSACKKNRSQAEGVHWTSKTLNQVGLRLENSLQTFRLNDSYSYAPAAQAPSQTRLNGARSDDSAASNDIAVASEATAPT